MVEGDLYGRAAATVAELRCWRCHRLLAAVVTEPYVIRCGRCKAENRGGVVPPPLTPNQG